MGKNILEGLTEAQLDQFYAEKRVEREALRACMYGVTKLHHTNEDMEPEMTCPACGMSVRTDPQTRYELNQRLLFEYRHPQMWLTEFGIDDPMYPLEQIKQIQTFQQLLFTLIPHE